MNHGYAAGRQQVQEQAQEVRRLLRLDDLVGPIALAVNDAGLERAFLVAGTAPWLSPRDAAELVDRAERLLWKEGFRVDVYWPTFAASTRWRTAVLAGLTCLARITPDPHARLMLDHDWYPAHWNRQTAGAA